MLELEYTLIPHGLHVVGEAPSAEQRVEMLQAVADASHGVRPDKSILEALVRGEAPEALAARDEASLALYKELAGIDRILQQDHEIPASCTRSTAASSVPRRAAICCARRRSCRPAAICMASIRSAFRAPLRCRTARSRRSG